MCVVCISVCMCARVCIRVFESVGVLFSGGELKLEVTNQEEFLIQDAWRQGGGESKILNFKGYMYVFYVWPLSLSRV